MTLRFSARAHAHLNAIYEYIHERNPIAAARVGARIQEAADILQIFPYAGRAGRSANTRELVVPGLPIHSGL
jgi:toxin ParE1/3/4